MPYFHHFLNASSTFWSCFFFLSSPNLSGRRLDVDHTCTHGVALVRIYNAGLKCAARGSLEIQDPKNRHLGTIAQLCRVISSQLRHVPTIGRNRLNSNISPTYPHNMGNFGPLTASYGLWNRANHYIFALWFLSIYFFLA